MLGASASKACQRAYSSQQRSAQQTPGLTGQVTAGWAVHQDDSCRNSVWLACHASRCSIEASAGEPQPAAAAHTAAMRHVPSGSLPPTDVLFVAAASAEAGLPAPGGAPEVCWNSMWCSGGKRACIRVDPQLTPATWIMSSVQHLRNMLVGSFAGAAAAHGLPAKAPSGA